MVVKIRFARGPVVTGRRGKNGRIATSSASLLTLVSISCASFGLWRIGTDLEWAGHFVFSSGLLSHWQVWMVASVAAQYTSWRLVRYARTTIPQEPELDESATLPAIGNV
jgi:hypothetical protein